MENKELNYTEKAIKSIGIIGEKEPELLVVVAEVLNHIANTYQDKYEGSKDLLNTKAQLYHPIRGASINTYQISRYLQRFMSEGFEKSGNKNDMMKIVHYAVFDMVRMNRIGDVKNLDIVDGKLKPMTDKEFDDVRTSK